LLLFYLDDSSSFACDDPGAHPTRGLYLARTGVVGFGSTDIETLEWPSFPWESPGMATICFTTALADQYIERKQQLINMFDIFLMLFCHKTQNVNFLNTDEKQIFCIFAIFYRNS
jgi:hypothetical protein